MQIANGVPPKIAVFLLGRQVTRTQRLPLGRADTERLRQESVHAAIPLCDRIARRRQERRVRAVKRADDLPLRLAQVIVRDRRQQAVGRGGQSTPSTVSSSIVPTPTRSFPAVQ